MLTLLLAYSLSPKVQSIFWGPHILKKAHQDDVLFLLYGTIYGREPNRMVGVRTWNAYFNLFENFDIGFWWIDVPLRFAVDVGILRFGKSGKSVNHFVGQVVIGLRKRSQRIPERAERIPKIAGMEWGVLGWQQPRERKNVTRRIFSFLFSCKRSCHMIEHGR